MKRYALHVPLTERHAQMGAFVAADLLVVKEAWPGGISYQEISQRAGLSKAHIVRIFQGKINPTVGTLAKIANALERTLHFELLTNEDKG